MIQVDNYKPNVDKMYTYLSAFLKGANMTESLKALGYARQKHSGQVRKNGQPYIAHPLSMACYAAALGIRDDNIMATILLLLDLILINLKSRQRHDIFVNYLIVERLLLLRLLIDIII